MEKNEGRFRNQAIGSLCFGSLSLRICFCVFAAKCASYEVEFKSFCYQAGEVFIWHFGREQDSFAQQCFRINDLEFTMLFYVVHLSF